jgi:hypothetical protein
MKCANLAGARIGCISGYRRKKRPLAPAGGRIFPAAPVKKRVLGMQSSSRVAASLLLALLLKAHAARADVFDTTRVGVVLGAGVSPQAPSLVAGAVLQRPLSGGVALGLELDFVASGAAYLDRGSKPRLLRLVPELSYHWEVLRLVPHVGLGAGYHMDLTRVSSGGVVAPSLGFDYLFSRTLRLGVEYRPVWYSNLRVAETQLLQHEVVLRLELGSGW